MVLVSTRSDSLYCISPHEKRCAHVHRIVTSGIPFSHTPSASSESPRHYRIKARALSLLSRVESGRQSEVGRQPRCAQSNVNRYSLSSSLATRGATKRIQMARCGDRNVREVQAGRRRDVQPCVGGVGNCSPAAALSTRQLGRGLHRSQRWLQDPCVECLVCEAALTTSAIYRRQRRSQRQRPWVVIVQPSRWALTSRGHRRQSAGPEHGDGQQRQVQSRTHSGRGDGRAGRTSGRAGSVLYGSSTRRLSSVVFARIRTWCQCEAK